MTDERPRTRFAADQAVKAERQTAKVSRHWPIISASVAVLLVALLGAIIVYREGSLEFDSEWSSWITEQRRPVWAVPALVMNFLGAGLFGVFILPIVVVVALSLFRRFWAAGYFLLASVISAGTVQLLKGIFDRARPEDMLVLSDHGSFPSGHVANAATIAVVFGLIGERTWIWVAGTAYTILMMLSRTYLGVHWVSDTIGGLVLGVAVAVVVWAPLAHRLHRERWQRTAFWRGREPASP